MINPISDTKQTTLEASVWMEVCKHIFARARRSIDILEYYILGIHTKIIFVDRSHIVVHLRLLGNSDFCNPINNFFEFCSKFIEKVYGFHNLLDHILWTYTIYHPLLTIRYSKLCIDPFYHYRGLCKLGSKILKGC